MPIPTGPIEIPLTLFGGLDTSLSPSDLPEGLSPANNDMVYRPGETSTRPCASKVFPAPFPGKPRVLAEKKFLQASGQPLNLYLDALGILRQEDVTNTPNTYTAVGNVTPGSMMKSATFDGVEYMAFSDGTHGIDIPREYDGTNFDRFTQDGPAGALTVADLISSIAIVNITSPAAVNIATISEQNGVITVITAAPHLLSQGDPVYIGVANPSPFNGAYQVKTVPSATEFSVSALSSPIAAAAAGTIQSNRITVNCAAPHGMVLGDFVAITGNASLHYNAGATFNTPVAQTFSNPPAALVDRIFSSTSFGTTVFDADIGAQAGGNAAIGGMISAGPHQLCCSFLFRNGQISKPGPISKWTAGGNLQANVTNLPIGPGNVIARILFPTGAFGGRFFWLPTDVSSFARATIIPDNTSTSAILDFYDTTLFGALGVDIPGNNLFNLVTLAPCLGIFSYADRVFAYGEFNKVQGLINLGFAGGTLGASPTVPLGWDVSLNIGGVLAASAGGVGLAFKITGDGVPANKKGLISQTAYQNSLMQQILEINTKYTFWAWAQVSGAGLAGNLTAVLSSVSTGFTSTATIAVNTISANGGFVHADFSLKTPAVIPSDLILQVFSQGMANLAWVAWTEGMMIFTAQPYRDTVMRGSYVNNPASFDGLTGDLGPESDPNPIVDIYQLREELTILTSKRRHVTQDNSNEPGKWKVDEIESDVGAASIHSTATGPNWAMWLSDTGKSVALRVTAGGESFKISREMKTDFGAVNMAAKKTIWIANVEDDSRVYMGIPQGEAASPNIMAVLDYFESDTAEQLAQNRPLKIGFTGKMLTTDLGRKWTMWRLPMACGAVLARPSGIEQLVVGSGSGPGTLGPFGNVYTFDVNKLTDDDYGGMLPSYTTFFFVNHETEQQMQLGGLRKLYSKATTFITGVGNLQILPHANKLGNVPKLVIDAGKLWALSTVLADDLEFTGLDVTARRCAFQVVVTPLPGTTDVKFSLSHLSCTLQRHPTSPEAASNRSYP